MLRGDTLVNHVITSSTLNLFRQADARDDTRKNGTSQTYVATVSREAGVTMRGESYNPNRERTESSFPSLSSRMSFSLLS